jgi:hypothetical protein
MSIEKVKREKEKKRKSKKENTQKTKKAKAKTKRFFCSLSKEIHLISKHTMKKLK